MSRYNVVTQLHLVFIDTRRRVCFLNVFFWGGSDLYKKRKERGGCFFFFFFFFFFFLGEFGILPNHVPFLSALGIGNLHYNQSGKAHYVFIAGGFAEVSSNKVTILAEVAEKATEIDVTRAQKAKERAEQRAAAAKEKIEAARNQAALKRAISRINCKSNGQSAGTLQPDDLILTLQMKGRLREEPPLLRDLAYVEPRYRPSFFLSSAQTRSGVTRFMHWKWPLGQTLGPCRPQGRQSKSVSMTWAFSPRGKNPKALTVGPNKATRGVPWVQARCMGPESLVRQQSNLPRQAASSGRLSRPARLVTCRGSPCTLR
eukprot:TRINITY_DN11344_c0_g4_i1.p1 TRINITY_DN11344_c0_g4~~TRINITY_DN11344_c0_g4_i1.p1  ORF type:complete len:315 (+),score=54.65 TRINITY_DN11344_c0_g4_i1:51-995(+)